MGIHRHTKLTAKVGRLEPYLRGGGDAQNHTLKVAAQELPGTYSNMGIKRIYMLLPCHATLSAATGPGLHCSTVYIAATD